MATTHTTDTDLRRSLTLALSSISCMLIVFTLTGVGPADIWGAVVSAFLGAVDFVILVLSSIGGLVS